MDRFLALQAFVRVAEAGSFAGAARSLNVSNPVISERVRQLEDLVGRQLLYRTTRSVSLTEAGIEAFPVYLELVHRMDDIENAAPAALDAVTGRVRVASVIDFGLSHIGPALSRLAAENPALQVELNLDNRLVNPLTEGFDVVVHFRHLTSGNLRSRHLNSVENGYFVSPAYISRFGEPKVPDDLRVHRCIGYSLQANTDAWDNGRWDIYHGSTMQSVPVTLTMTTNSGHILKRLTLDGHGVAVLPLERVWEEHASGSLIRVLPEHHPETLSLSAIFPSSHAKTYKVQRLLRALEEAFT